MKNISILALALFLFFAACAPESSNTETEKDTAADSLAIADSLKKLAEQAKLEVEREQKKADLMAIREAIDAKMDKLTEKALSPDAEKWTSAQAFLDGEQVVTVKATNVEGNEEAFYFQGGELILALKKGPADIEAVPHWFVGETCISHDDNDEDAQKLLGEGKALYEMASAE